MFRIYDVWYQIHDYATDSFGQSHCKVLAKSRTQAINTVFKHYDRFPNEGNWELVKVKASLAKNQKARIL